MAEIDRGKSDSRESNKRRARAIKAALLVALLFAVSLALLPGPSSDDPPASVPAGSSYASHGRISIDGDSGFNNASGVVWGSGTESDPYIISGWDIDAAGGHGIQIMNTNAYFIVRDCYVHGGSFSFHGIALSTCSNGTLTNNTLTNDNYGISLTSSSGNTMTYNNCSNGGYGIYLSSSNGNIMRNNTCNSCTYYGIRFDSSSSNTLTGNNCSYSQIGIGLNSASNGNGLNNNTCKSNSVSGLVLSQSSSNTLTGNNCSKNSNYGIRLISSNSDNLSWNKMCNNSKQGIYISSGSANHLWNNTFIGNNGGGIQAYDSGTSNRWNTSGSPHGYGNYWSTLTGPDNNLDGIVDWSYNLTGTAGAKDMYPRTTSLPIPEFSDIIIPIVGMMTVTFAFIRARKKC